VAHLAFLVAVHGRIFAELIAKKRHQSEHEKSEDKIGHKGAESCESDACEVHLETLPDHVQVTGKEFTLAVYFAAIVGQTGGG
jgi:hypothetical protein